MISHRAVAAFTVGDAPPPVLPREQELWLAVIALAVQDALRGCTKAAAWLYSPIYREDFHLACSLADVEPEYVHSLAARGLVEGAAPVLRTAATSLEERRAKLKRRLPATSQEILNSLSEFYGRQYRRASCESRALYRDLKAIGAKKEDGEWRI